MSTLLDLISSRLIGVKRGADGTLTSACPACLSEGSDSAKCHLRVWPSGAFNCSKHSGDKEHNTLIRRAIRGDSTTELSLILSGDLDEYIDPEPRPDVVKVYEEALLEKLAPDYTYWVGRGIKPEVLRVLGGGVAKIEEKSKLSGRFILPCRDTHGRIIGWAGRQLDDASFGPRWKILGRKGLVLFPPTAILDPAVRAAGEVILVEGQGCVMALMSAGINQVVSLFGVVPSSKVLSHLIALNPARIIVATNNERDKVTGGAEGVGIRAAETIKKRLCSFFREDRIEIRLPLLKDFADMTEEQILQWHAQPAASPVVEEAAT